MIEAAKVIVPIGVGREVEARASTSGLEAQTEPYAEDGLDEVLVWTEEEANLLRSTIDAGDYKQFIFPLLFYKRLCDVYYEERAEAL
jgi:hypothetical protein